MVRPQWRASLSGGGGSSQARIEGQLVLVALQEGGLLVLLETLVRQIGKRKRKWAGSWLVGAGGGWRLVGVDGDPEGDPADGHEDQPDA